MGPFSEPGRPCGTRNGGVPGGGHSRAGSSITRRMPSPGSGMDGSGSPPSASAATVRTVSSQSCGTRVTGSSLPGAALRLRNPTAASCSAPAWSTPDPVVADRPVSTTW